MTFRHETSSCGNSNIHCPSCPKLHKFDKSPSLKTSTCQYSVKVIAPPTDNRKSALCDKDHPIYMKFTWCGLQMISSNMTYNYCLFSSAAQWTQGTDIYLVQAVSNGHENSKPCRPASCEDTAAAVPPDVSETARACSTLLAALISYHEMLLPWRESVFEELGMLENSRNLAHTSEGLNIDT